MQDLRDMLIKPETKNRLRDHGLNVTVYSDQSCPSPRNFTKSVFVGCEVDIPRYVYNGKYFDDGIAEYCRKELDCDVTDIVWKAVYQLDHSGVTYSINAFPSHVGGDSAIEGFIYLTKKQIREEFELADDEEINQKLLNIITLRFSDEMEKLTSWSNGWVYDVNVSTSGSCDNGVGLIEGNRYEVNGSVDRDTNVLIDDVIRIIDDNSHAYNPELLDTVELTLSIDTNSLPAETTVSRYLIHHVNKWFMVKLGFGSISFDVETGLFKGNLLLSGLPLFRLLGSDLDTNLFKKTRQHVKSIAGGGDFEPMDSDDIMDVLTDSEHYSNWPELMKHALVVTLLDGLEGVSVISVKNAGKSISV